MSRKFQADSRMNVVNDRANATVVRVYELTSRANVDRAYRAALWRDDSAALGAEPDVGYLPGIP